VFGSPPVVTSRSGEWLSAPFTAATTASGHAVPFAKASAVADGKNRVATSTAVA
jgi:hypothetical protein